jgi:two-component system cell cycle sensor histidine kinase/response regulator CckA
LAGGVAHDFNNIIAAISGNVELARQDVGDEHPAQQSLEEIRKASLRAKQLIQQILSFGRRQVTQRSVISLAPVVEESMRLLRVTLPAGVGLTVHCDADVPAVLADAAQIEQVLLNLCTNAWHATEGQERAGEIEVRLVSDMRSRPGLVSLTVRDNGHGMDAATQARIFEPFFTTKSVEKGTGLGLSVVHGIVIEHEASIDVQSTVGEGTTIVIRFPVAPEATPAEPGQNQHDSEKDRDKTLALRAEGAHVLYIDDDEAIVLLMTRLLERQGYRVSGYTNPEEALAATRGNPNQFDLVVTDYNMPGMSGLEVASALREIRADLPVVLASGYITEGLQQKAPAAGVRELIYKPNTVDELCAAIARLAQTTGKTSKAS